MKQYKT